MLLISKDTNQKSFKLYRNLSCGKASKRKKESRRVVKNRHGSGGNEEKRHVDQTSRKQLQVTHNKSIPHKETVR